MELDFDKYCVVDGSPTTVLPALRRRSKIVDRKSNGKPKFGNDLLSVKGDFTEISFNRFRSVSCNDTRRSNREGKEMMKRGSVYQCSKEVKQLRRTDAVGGRKKIEFSRGSTSVMSFGIIDSLCSSDEDGASAEQDRSALMPLSEQSVTAFSKKQVEDSEDYSFDKREKLSESTGGKGSHGRDSTVGLDESILAKLALPHSLSKSERCPNIHFTPVRKNFDPFLKYKSHRSLLSSINETVIDHNEIICKSRLNDSSDSSQREKKLMNHNVAPVSSPAHLHGLLKLEKKCGIPFFEFSMKSPQDVYVAKTWKADDTLTWKYTFHSLHHRRKSNASGWGSKDINKESSFVGQMVVSCYLRTDLKGAGALSETMVTEFVLYDIAHSRKSVSSQDNSTSSIDGTKSQVKNSCDSNRSESSTTKPLPAAELHPQLETAAIVVEVPFNKRESLKLKSGDRKKDNPVPKLMDLCLLENTDERFSYDDTSPGKMHVVIPAGNHSLPSSESYGPSPLVNRWRLGGGCDCGGWDMACSLTVLDNPDFHIGQRLSALDNHHLPQLFFQGRKDNVPAFSMRAIEEGKYEIDFHGQLSSLQAFSICVAILHAAEASTTVEHDSNRVTWQSDLLRVFPEMEMKSSVDDLGEEDRVKKMEEVVPSLALNPPFSPIARV